MANRSKGQKGCFGAKKWVGVKTIKPVEYEELETKLVKGVPQSKMVKKIHMEETVHVIDVKRPNRAQRGRRGVTMKRRGHRPTILSNKSILRKLEEQQRNKPRTGRGDSQDTSGNKKLGFFERMKRTFQRKSSGS